jgi:hypothetical protein
MTPLYDNLITLMYLLFGAAGTACRVAISTTLVFGKNKRTIVEVAFGGAGGAVLAWFGPQLVRMAGLPPESAGTMPPLIKGLVVFLVCGATSLGVGELIARKLGAKPPEEPKP